MHLFTCIFLTVFHNCSLHLWALDSTKTHDKQESSLSHPLSSSFSLCLSLLLQDSRHRMGDMWLDDHKVRRAEPANHFALSPFPKSSRVTQRKQHQESRLSPHNSLISCCYDLTWRPAVCNNAESWNTMCFEGNCFMFSGCGRRILAMLLVSSEQRVSEINRTFHHIRISVNNVSRATVGSVNVPQGWVSKRTGQLRIQDGLWQRSAQLWGARAGKTGKMEEIKSLWQIWQSDDDCSLSERETGNFILVTQCHKNEGSHRQMGDKWNSNIKRLSESSFSASHQRNELTAAAFVSDDVPSFGVFYDGVMKRSGLSHVSSIGLRFVEKHSIHFDYVHVWTYIFLFTGTIWPVFT